MFDEFNTITCTSIGRSKGELGDVSYLKGEVPLLRQGTKVEVSESIKKKLTKFYQGTIKFDDFKGYKEDVINISSTISFKNETIVKNINAAHDYCLRDTKALFGETAYKYWFVPNFKIADGMAKYDEIDIMGKKKKVCVSVAKLYEYFRKQEKISQMKPQEMVSNFSVDITISNDLDHKEILIDKAGFNGSCQRSDNYNSLSRGFYDIFNNGGLVFCKYSIGTTFLGRLFFRMLYDKDGTMFLHMDRLYSEGIVSQQVSAVLQETIKLLNSHGYNVLLTERFNAATKIEGEFRSKPRKYFGDLNRCYYHNKGTKGFLTTDKWMYDIASSNFNDLYVKYGTHQKDKKAS